ncbi:MAG: tetratricopeptide repeat protein [Planctomycetaceae bacterium]|nr:tetratricopeptide repeat protein [Planctomycetaceae bacterium]
MAWVRRVGFSLVLILVCLAGRSNGIDAPAAALTLPDEAARAGGLDEFTRLLVDNALICIDSNNLAEAGRFIDRALAESPGNPILLQVRAHLVVKTGDWRRAEQALTALLDVQPDHREALVWRAYARYRLRDSAGSELDAARVAGRDDDLGRYAADLLAVVGALRNALDTMIDEGWSDIHEREAALTAAADRDGLEELYNVLEQVPGMTAYVAAARGLMRLRFGDIDQAGEAFEAALARDDIDPVVRADLEMLLLQVRRDQRERAAWDETGRRIAAALDSGDIPGLEDYLGELAGIDRFRAFAHAARGFLRLGEGRNREARPDLTTALTSESLPEPVEADVRSALAMASSRVEEPGFAELRDLLALLRDAGADDEIKTWYADLARSDRLGIFALIPKSFESFRQDACDSGIAAACDAGTRNRLSPTLIRELEETLARHAAVRSVREDWDTLLVRVKELEENDDDAGLEAVFTEMAGTAEYAAFGLSSRGFLYLDQGKDAAAEADFTEALAAPGLEPAVRNRIDDALATIRRDRSEAARWQGLVAEMRGLAATGGDDDRLEEIIRELLANDHYRGQALAARGMLRLRRDNRSDAEKDLREALTTGGLDVDTRVDIMAVLARMDIDRRAREIEDAGDLDGLEAFYQDLTAHPEYRTSALASRGYLRWRRGNNEDAVADFLAALDRPDLTPAARREIESALGEIDETVRRQAAWHYAESRLDGLADNLDIEGALAVADDILAAQPDNAEALARRGEVRIAFGDIFNGRADLREAVERLPFGSTRRDTAEALLDAIETALNSETTPANPFADAAMERVDALLAAQELTAAGRLLAASIELPLDPVQTGLQSYYLGELHWRTNSRAEASVYFAEAAASAIDAERRSEAYWKVSTHALEVGKSAEALRCAEESANVNRSNAAALARTGFRCATLRQDAKVIHYFEEALRLDDAIGQDSDLHRLLAAAYLRCGSTGRFRTHMRRHIDTVQARMGGCGPVNNCDYLSWYWARRDHANAAKRFRGTASVRTARLDGGDYVAENVNGLFYRISGFRALPVEAYLRTAMAAYGRMDDPYGYERYGEVGVYADSVHPGDNFTVAAGARAELGGGVFAALERVFGIGRDTRNDTRLRLGHTWSRGEDRQPVAPSWWYARTDMEAIYSLEHDDVSFTGDFRAGRSFRLDQCFDCLVVTPYLGLSVLAASDQYLTGTDHWAADAVPGVALRRWLNEDRYNAQVASWELSLEYRVGLSRERRNMLAMNLLYNF